MARTYDSSDLVQLPVLDASAAQALGKEMVVAAEGERLPAAVEEALEELASAHTALEGAVARRLAASPSGVDPTRTRAADLALDAAWSALYGVVRSWSRVPHHPEGAVAAALLPKLFPNGVKFVLLPYKLEWAESSTRLLLIEQEALAGEVEKLGCASLLPLIRAAHREYGDALGVTTVPEPESTALTVRDAFDAFMGALRDYIIRVRASIRRREPETHALAQTLLAPIQRWEDPRGAVKAAERHAVPPSGAPALLEAEPVAVATCSAPAQDDLHGGAPLLPSSSKRGAWRLPSALEPLPDAPPPARSSSRPALDRPALRIGRVWSSVGVEYTPLGRAREPAQARRPPAMSGGRAGTVAPHLPDRQV
jgi:hypothetical protein